MILDYNPSMKQQLACMMTAYMAELKSDIPEEIIRGRLSDYIDEMSEKGIIRIRIAFDGQLPIAFSVFQIDRQESDWCMRPGWGFIREYYVSPEYRKQGVGKILAEDTEYILQDLGAADLYLTSTGAVPFWQKCGWRLTAAVTPKGQSILEKHF